MKLRKSVTKDLLDLLQGKGEGLGIVGMSCNFFRIAVKRGKCGKTG